MTKTSDSLWSPCPRLNWNKVSISLTFACISQNHTCMKSFWDLSNCDWHFMTFHGVLFWESTRAHGNNRKHNKSKLYIPCTNHDLSYIIILTNTFCSRFCTWMYCQTMEMFDQFRHMYYNWTPQSFLFCTNKSRLNNSIIKRILALYKFSLLLLFIKVWPEVSIHNI